MMRFLIALVLLVPMAPAQQTLATLVDRNRVLLVFAPSAMDGRFGEQVSAFDRHEAELRARDLVVIPLLQQAGPPAASAALRNLQPPRISDDEQLTLRRRFHVGASEFEVILLGKDGGEKLRSKVPITLARLNKTIDAMPMRKQEMKVR
jgi:hypothetical protein